MEMEYVIEKWSIYIMEMEMEMEMEYIIEKK